MRVGGGPVIMTTWDVSAVAAPGEMMTYGTRMTAAATAATRRSDAAIVTIDWRTRRRRERPGGCGGVSADGWDTASPFPP